MVLSNIYGYFQFLHYVSNYFSSEVLVVQSDWGGGDFCPPQKLPQSFGELLAHIHMPKTEV